MQRIDAFIAQNQVPHIIFHGPAGSGKRTLVLDMIRKLYGGCRRTVAANVQFVNCAQTKGIKFIREDIKNFARASVQNSAAAPFKSVVLFNADCLTADAQSALRRSIELFSGNTRFFIVVRDKHRLLTPILSRFCEIYVPPRAGQYKDAAETDPPGIAELFECARAAGRAGVVPRLVAAAEQWYAAGVPPGAVARAAARHMGPDAAAELALFYAKVRGNIKNDPMLAYIIMDFALFGEFKFMTAVV
jgi:hypothetical protein